MSLLQWLKETRKKIKYLHIHLSHFILAKSFKLCYFPHLANKETEAASEKLGDCSRLQNEQVVELGVEPSPPDTKAHTASN